jgi:hypothetical protein
MLKRLFSILSLLLAAYAPHAQELNCKVTVTHDKITGVDNEVFSSMTKAITEFINQHKWTSDEYATNEKIDCSFFINLTGNKAAGDPDGYTATLSLQASRPVYGSSYTTSLVNYVDRDIVFKFNQFTTLQFDDNRITGTEPMSSNLTAILAYYAYIILALDYDSYAPDGGTNLLKKAQNIVNNAPEQNKVISGWKPVEGSKNRYWLTDQLLNQRFHDVRSFWYTMHREGLDSMYTKPIDSRMRILYGLKKLYQVNRENPSSMLIQFLFAAKSEEFILMLSQTPKNDRGQFITLLTSMDVPNATKYNNLK